MQQEDKEVEIRKIVQDTMEAERKIQRNRMEDPAEQDPV